MVFILVRSARGPGYAGSKGPPTGSIGSLMPSADECRYGVEEKWCKTTEVQIFAGTTECAVRDVHMRDPNSALVAGPRVGHPAHACQVVRDRSRPQPRQLCFQIRIRPLVERRDVGQQRRLTEPVRLTAGQPAGEPVGIRLEYRLVSDDRDPLPF